MSPQDRQRLEKLEKMVLAIQRAENVAFIENLTRRLNSTLTIPKVLSDLSDVAGTDTATTGQVLKKTATTWQPGTDNIA